MEKEAGRVEAFGDGVFAIAITLLILEIKVPRLAHDSPPGAPGDALLAEHRDGRALNAAAAPCCGTFVLTSLSLRALWAVLGCKTPEEPRSRQSPRFPCGVRLSFATLKPRSFSLPTIAW